MSKILRKMTSLLTVMGMSISTVCMPVQAATPQYYATNSDGYGKESTITIDGKFDDWTGDMLIAQGVANDDARIFRGSHEGPVYDSYALYSAWDDENLYLMWQFVNVTDVVDPAQGYPISDNGKPWNGDIPQIIALSIDPGKGDNGKCLNEEGEIDDNIWGIKVNYETPVDTVLYFSSKPGVGKPALFKVNDEGYFDYNTAVDFKEAGISFKYGDGLHSSIKSLMGIKSNGYSGYTPADLYDDTAFSDMLKEGHDTNQDTMYEMAIPLKSLGITREYIEKNGIGAMHISTFGQSGIASVPYDRSMLDVATQPYTPDESTSAEKEDTDIITTALAEIGTDRGIADKGDTDSGNTGEGSTDSGNTGDGSTDSGNTDGDNTGSGNTDSGNTDEDNMTGQDEIIPISQLGTGSSKSSTSGNGTELADSVDDGTILHAWNWSLKTIEEKLPEIAAAGYTSIQTSPMQGTKESSMEGSKWWLLYQPTNFEIGNAQLGTRDDLLNLCKAADEYGIKIIVDVIFNHTANISKDNISPMVDAKLRNNADFWHLPLKSIDNYNNRDQVTQQDVDGLPDLNTSNKELQGIIIDYLNDLISCGVDGFRVDTAKHIELPSDNISSDFWPTITSAMKDKNVFIYGEVLQGGADNYYNYAPYLDLTASNYGYALRDAVGFTSSKSVNNVKDYNSNGVNASKLITFVETHDNYANNQCESTAMNDWQVKMGWAITASRAYVTPLYFNRPTSNSGVSKFAPLLGTAGNDNWQDADTVAINKFHNAMVGQGENLKVINNQLLMIERGDQGVVLVNLGDQTTISTSTALKTGTYTNQGSLGGTFTAADNTLSGTVPAGGIVVLYNAPASTNGPVVSITGESSTFKTDAMKITLGVSNAASATYSIDSGSEVSYTDGQVISIGDDKAYNTVTTVKVKATTSEGTAETSCRYIKLDPKAKAIVYFDNSEANWSDVNAYIYDESTGTTKEVAKWPGVAMTKEGEHLYSYTIPSDLSNAKVIFNDGSTNQIPPAKAEGYTVTSPMIYTKGEMCYNVAAVANQNKPSVSISPAETNFEGSTLTLTLGAQNATSSVYSIDDGEEKAYSDGEKITINNITKGQCIKVTLKANSIEGEVTQSYTYTNVDTSKPAVKEGELKAYCYKPDTWGNTLNVYVYDESSSNVRELSAWPGVAMTKEEDGLYSCELDASWENARVIFNDGINQYPVTEGLLLDCSRYYDDGEWVPCEVIANNEVSVSAVPGDETTYQGSLEITLGVKGNETATYRIDDQEAVSYTDGQVITIGKDVEEGITTKLTLTVLNDQGEEVTQDYNYYKEVTNIGAVYDITFNKPSNWGEDINVYIYDESGNTVKQLAPWPGVAMKKMLDGTYTYTLPTDWKYAQVIFNDGSQQTPASGQSGFVYNGIPMVYKDGTWKVFTWGENPTELTAYFDNSAINWSNVNAYIYDESDSTVKEVAPWPGVPMTSEGNSIYSYTFKQDWENAKVIFNNGNTQIPASGQTGFSLYTNMMYSNGSWIVY